MLESYLEKLAAKFEDEEHKINTIATLLGCAANFVEFIDKNHDKKEMDPPLLYAMALVAQLVVALTRDEKFEFKNVSEKTKEYYMGEQTQEQIFRTMKEIVTEIYNAFQERDDE